MAESRPASAQIAKHQTDRSQQGFALASVIALLPLLLTLLIGVAGGLWILKRKAQAQTACVRTGTHLQEALRRDLLALLKLNPQARILRRRREAADKAFKRALATGQPYAIAAAKAVRTAVILEQLALKARQERILAEAARARQQAQRELAHETRRLRLGSVHSRHHYVRPLAVEPRPAQSLTPDYEPVTRFHDLQRHAFEFAVDLRPPFWTGLPGSFRQPTRCTVSLEGKVSSWSVRILAASAWRN